MTDTDELEEFALHLHNLLIGKDDPSPFEQRVVRKMTKRYVERNGHPTPGGDAQEADESRELETMFDRMNKEHH